MFVVSESCSGCPESSSIDIGTAIIEKLSLTPHLKLFHFQFSRFGITLFRSYRSETMAMIQGALGLATTTLSLAWKAFKSGVIFGRFKIEPQMIGDAVVAKDLQTEMDWTKREKK
jgi:hypothetical protein